MLRLRGLRNSVQGSGFRVKGLRVGFRTDGLGHWAY